MFTVKILVRLAIKFNIVSNEIVLTHSLKHIENNLTTVLQYLADTIMACSIRVFELKLTYQTSKKEI